VRFFDYLAITLRCTVLSWIGIREKINDTETEIRDPGPLEKVKIVWQYLRDIVIACDAWILHAARMDI
jgi:hypothetical protein